MTMEKAYFRLEKGNLINIEKEDTERKDKFIEFKSLFCATGGVL